MSISNVSNVTSNVVSSNALPASNASRTQAPTEAPKNDKAPSREIMQDMMQKANEALQATQPGLRFKMDPDNGQTLVQLVDQETQKVIRQIPSVEMVEISKALEKMQGVLISKEA